MITLDILASGYYLFFSTPVRGLFPLSTYLKSEILLPEKRKEIEAKMNEVANKMGIQKKLELVEIKDWPPEASSQGNTIFPGRVEISVDAEKFNEKSSDEIEFILAHEISHIKNNDAIKGYTTAGLIGIITTVALFILCPALSAGLPIIMLSPAGIIGFLVSYVADSIFSRWREERADKSAFAICSENARRAIIVNLEESFFEEQNKNHRLMSALPMILRDILFTDTYECRLSLNFSYPTTKERISYLKDCMEKAEANKA